MRVCLIFTGYRKQRAVPSARKILTGKKGREGRLKKEPVNPLPGIWEKAGN
jgi:hypothetical protein